MSNLGDYYIWSYENNAWWKPYNMGYTTDLRAAGKYAEDEAVHIVTNANQCCGNKPNEAFVRVDSFLLQRNKDNE